eukprot:TRINITY_DN3134_c0_g3_i1.p1 TRINITY_DN3134_c0_g3~~TRINITY_DN3134_c0_g3_i1.p1  ORF type:complete len:373 (+),score=59.95 TRINITY_DN3134_c0_g3_i1:39-1157(+)
MSVVLGPLVETYKKWYLENTEFVSMLEQAMQFGQLLVPNRWSEHALQSDAYSAATNIVTSFHDHLWISSALELQNNGTLSGNPQISADTREKLEKTQHFPEEQLRISSLLSYISNAEILLELLAILGTDKKSKWAAVRNLRWTVISFLEVWKALLKFSMLVKSRGTMLAYQRLPSRKPKAVIPKMETQKGDDDTEEETDNEDDLDWRAILATKEGRPTIQSVQKQIEEIRKAKRNQNTTAPTRPSISLILGEVLWILRPLVFLLFLTKNGKKSWKPWIASAVVDFMSWKLQKKHEDKFNKPEIEEFQRRKGLWLLYLLRSPSPLVQILKSTTVSESFLAGTFSKVPGSATISTLFWSILDICSERYYYSAGS